jgi:hypothetical protein
MIDSRLLISVVRYKKLRRKIRKVERSRSRSEYAYGLDKGKISYPYGLDILPLYFLYRLFDIRNQ